jgi:predicted transcriptional regulator
MSAKELVMKSVRKMSDKMSMEEILEELSILAAIQRGEEAADAGKVISHQEMKKRLTSWTTFSSSPKSDSRSSFAWGNGERPLQGQRLNCQCSQAFGLG